MKLNWQEKLQSSIRDTVNSASTSLRDTVSTVSTTNLSDGVAKSLKGWSAAQQPGKVPPEAAKKLRYFENADLAALAAQHATEKQELLDANAALRQVLVDKGMQQAELDAKLQSLQAGVDKQRAQDEAVRSTLLASATAEIQALKQQVAAQAAELAAQSAELADASAAAAEAAKLREQLNTQAAEVEELRSSAAEADALRAQLQEQQQRVQELTATAADAERMRGQLRSQAALMQELQARLEASGGAGREAVPQLEPTTPRGNDVPASQQLLPSTSEALSETAEGEVGRPAERVDTAGVVEGLLQQLDPFDLSSPQGPKASANGVGSEEQASSSEGEPGTHGSPAAATDSTIASEQHPAAAGVDGPPDAAFSLGDDDGESPQLLGAPLEEQVKMLRQSLSAEQQRAAALLDKIQRVEEERRGHFDAVSDLQAKVAVLEGELQGTAEGRQALQAELETTRTQLAKSQATAEKRLEELRGKVGTNAAQQSEMLRQAQEICEEADQRADAAEKALAEARAANKRLEGEVKEFRAETKRLEKAVQAKDKEREAAELRAIKAEAALDSARLKGQAEASKGVSFKQAKAELEAKHQEAVNKHLAHIAGLEADIMDLKRAAAKAEAEVGHMERRLTESQEAEGRLLHELRDLEALAADREELAVRVAALEDRLDETRAERGQLENYKQLARDTEAAKARVEAELVQTVKIAAGLESRIRTSQAAAEAAQVAGAAAEKRAYEAEQRVAFEVEARLEKIGANRSLWPRVAREEVGAAEAKAATLSSMMDTLQKELEAEVKGRILDAQQRASVEERVAAAEDRASRVEWAARDTEDRLKRQLADARQEVHELRTALAAANEQKAAGQKRDAANSLSRAASFQRRGGGTLLGTAAPTANGTKEALTEVDLLYLKNVLLKFVEAHSLGKLQERDALLPAVAALVRASPQEFKALKTSIESAEAIVPASWWKPTS